MGDDGEITIGRIRQWLRKRRKAIVAALVAVAPLVEVWATPGPVAGKIGAAALAIAGVVGVERIPNARR